MMMKWYLVLSALQFSCSMALCPDDCACNTDLKGRLQILCSKYKCHTNFKPENRNTIFLLFVSSSENLRIIPAKTLDQNVEVLTITDSKSPLTISPIFIPFTKLQVLQINDANVQSIGMHSFWGVQSLRVLGTYMLEC